MPEDERSPRAALPPGAVVVRAGEMGSKSLWDNAVTHHTQFQEWALSVAADSNMSAEEIAIGRRLRNRSMRASTVGDIRDGGFEVVRDPDDAPYGPELHALILLPIDPSDEPTEETWDELRSCFGEREPNPAYEMFRR